MQKTSFAIIKDNHHAEMLIGQASFGLKKKIYLTVKLEGTTCYMEMDTGLSMSLVSWSTIKRLVSNIVKK